MSESGGQKPVRNSLLSAATTSNFFEDAAMLVPVSLVEPETVEPAISEIDLNSDDTSSNRDSVDKDFMEPINLQEDEPESMADDPAPPISLFSRASTGVDAFTRMLTGASAPSKEITVLRAPAMSDTNSVTELEPTFSGSSGNMMSSPAETTPATTSWPVSTSAVQTSNFVSASTLFSQSATEYPDITASFENTASGSTTYLGMPSAPISREGPPPSVSAAGTLTFPPAVSKSSYAVPSAFAGIQSGSVPSLTPSNPVFPSQLTDPMSMSSGLPITSNVSPNFSTPPPASGGSNAFRLSGQKMKYVPCREIPSVPSLTPALPAAIIPPSQGPMPQTFMPPPPSYDASNNGLFSAATIPPPLVGAPSSFVGAAPSSTSTTYFGTAPNLPTPIGSAAASASSTSYFSTPTPGLTSPIGSSSGNIPPLTTSHMQTNTYYSNPPEAQQFVPQRLSPLTFHWFFRKNVDGKTTWKPFSIIDSVALEDAFGNDPERLVSTDGGRYDVSVTKRVKMAVYWDEAPVDVRRSSWFYKGPLDKRFVPYDEEFSLRLEREYSDCMASGVWQKRLEFPDGESVILHNAGVVVHFCQAAAPDDWGNLPESQIRPRVVKRGCEEMELEDGEAAQVDHLVFVVHGIGPICDFKLRNIVEAVDDFRGLSFQLLSSHFHESIDKGMVGRVEFLPVSWHKALHGDKGIDEQLKRITLKSIPKFRDFTNDTLLDILFYTSPMFCQTIITSVGSELNRLYKMFQTRNPSFKGQVSLTGHSLGSLILFDLLAHQPLGDSKPTTDETDLSVDGEEPVLTAKAEQLNLGASSRTVSYTVGNAGTGQPYINYPPLEFAPNAFFALGSPIAMFVTVRGIENLGNDFRLPNCPAFFNIFHPYDPVAYRMETLIDPTFESRPVLIPHHKGRKRIHLELKETMARVGADIKQKVVDAFKNTWNTVYQYTGLSTTEIQNAIAGEIEKRSEAEGPEDENSSLRIGSLNGGRRIDHVLQEAPYETFNEYVFAMSTHVGYWESEDTMLLILTEVYESMGIQRDRVVSPGMMQQYPHVPPPPSMSHPIANSYVAPNTPSYGNQYIPSAPPSSDYTGVLQHSASSPVLASTAFNSPFVPQPVPQATSVPLIPSPTQISDVGPFVPPIPGAAPVGVQSPGNRPTVIGNRPVTDPTFYPRGMDPTAPMPTLSQVGPPPKGGFVPKPN